MKKAKKILVMVAALALTAAIAVGGTLAYLTSKTEVVTNTFTVGNVKITLDEAKVTVEGVKDGDSRVTENTYKLMPGHTYVKDPTVHVDKDSENSWLFVKVTDEIAGIQDTKTVAAQMAEKGWTLVDGQTNIYAYKDVVKANDNIVVFDNFKIKGTETDLSDYAGKTITVQAYAVQKDGFDTAAAAWAAAPLAAWTTSAN